MPYLNKRIFDDIIYECLPTTGGEVAAGQVFVTARKKKSDREVGWEASINLHSKIDHGLAEIL